MFVSFQKVLEAVKELYIFDGVEVLVSLELKDLALKVHVELVAPEHGEGACLAERKDALFVPEGNFQPPAEEAQRRVLRDGELVLIEDDLFHRGVFLV